MFRPILSFEHPVLRQEARHEADAADVDVAILAGKPQSFRQVGPYFVAVEHFDRADALEPRRNRAGERALPRTGQPGEPQNGASHR